MRNHPERYALSNELHARPFPELAAPCRAVFLAIRPEDGAERDRALDRAHLLDLLDRHGASHPPPGASHYSASLGRVRLKWESHTEFVTYTLFADGVAETPFDGKTLGQFPADWLEAAPGDVLSSALVRVEAAETAAAAEARLTERLIPHFVRESLAISRVLDGGALIASDFRIHEHDQIRFAAIVTPEIGPRRVGRLVQRLLEIETYKTAAMLTLPVARKIAGRVNELDRELSGLVQAMGDADAADTERLERLLKMSGEIEAMSAGSAFRFGAAGAYEAIVGERIEVLREERIGGRQTFGEFMARRFAPAMRTCRSAERRLNELAERTGRAADLLSTRVDVGLAQSNRELLRSMDRRAALQLRLQQTVEGFSVVAISYYSVSLAGYALGPLAAAIGMSETWLTAAVTIPILVLVWLFVRRVREGITKDDRG
ncbi:MAG: DUF3422 domain-containing protein [Pseudomonadota bacterium]